MSTLTRTGITDILNHKLKLEIQESAFNTASIQCVNHDVDTETLELVFTGTPSGADETGIDAIIASHDSTPIPEVDQRITVTDENKTLAPYELVVGVVGITATRTITLPLASQVSPLYILSIANEDESARSNKKISLATQGGDTISGVTHGDRAGIVLFARSNGVNKWTVRSL